MVFGFTSLVSYSSMNRLRRKEQYSKITHVFISNNVSCTITIPVELAREYGITVPNYVRIFDTKDGKLVNH